MNRPLIGINCKLITDGGDTYYKLDRNYVRSVERAGGAPVLMPAFRTAAEGRQDHRLAAGALDRSDVVAVELVVRVAAVGDDLAVDSDEGFLLHGIVLT